MEDLYARLETLINERIASFPVPPLDLAGDGDGD